MLHAVWSGLLRVRCSETPAYHGHHPILLGARFSPACWYTKTVGGGFSDATPFSPQLTHPMRTSSSSLLAAAREETCSSKGVSSVAIFLFRTPKSWLNLLYPQKSDCQKYFHVVGGSTRHQPGERFLIDA